jgi:hypothetical protein
MMSDDEVTILARLALLSMPVAVLRRPFTPEEIITIAADAHRLAHRFYAEVTRLTAERDDARGLIEASKTKADTKARAARRWRAKAEAAETALTDARAQGRADGLRMAVERIAAFVVAEDDASCTLRMDAAIKDFEAENCEETARLYRDVILAPILTPKEPRRASGPIDPEQGFATTGAEAQWIADTDAGVYDNAPCPICGSELWMQGLYVHCRQCAAPADGGKG